MTKILQLKVSLNESAPLIWRRILVEDSITFHELHKIIQKAMDWDDYHMYDFCYDKIRIEPDKGQGFAVDAMWTAFKPKMKTLYSTKTRLNELLKEKKRLSYTYDLGDNWKHNIIVEKILEKDEEKEYPSCVSGDLACPPEDCGGISGYYEMLNAVEDKKHPEHRHWIEWIGEFDPEKFDIEDINDKLSFKSLQSKGSRKLGRNEPCHCGSSKKYKKCCLDRDLKETGKVMRI